MEEIRKKLQPAYKKLREANYFLRNSEKSSNPNLNGEEIDFLLSACSSALGSIIDKADKADAPEFATWYYERFRKDSEEDFKFIKLMTSQRNLNSHDSATVFHPKIEYTPMPNSRMFSIGGNREGSVSIGFVSPGVTPSSYGINVPQLNLDNISVPDRDKEPDLYEEWQDRLQGAANSYTKLYTIFDKMLDAYVAYREAGNLIVPEPRTADWKKHFKKVCKEMAPIIREMEKYGDEFQVWIDQSSKAVFAMETILNDTLDGH